MLLAYFGPETVLPVTSALAGIAGFFLMFGRVAVAFCKGSVRKAMRLMRRRPATPSLPISVDGRKVRRDDADGASPSPLSPAVRPKRAGR